MGEFADLAIVAGVARLGSFTSCARELGVDRSAVSRRVAALERRLGVQLFQRSTRHCRLTEFGEFYHRHCSRILDALDEINSEVGGRNGRAWGSVRVSAPIMFGLHRLIELFPGYAKQQPGVTIRLALTELCPTQHADDFDVAFFVGDLPSSTLISRRIGTSRRLICASPAYLEAFGTPRDVKELSRRNCLLLGSAVRSEARWHFAHEGRKTAVKVSGNLLVNAGDGLYQAVLQGHGIGQVMDFRAEGDIRQGRLVPLFEGQLDDADLPIFLVYHSKNYLPLKVRTLIDFVTTRLQAHPDG